LRKYKNNLKFIDILYNYVIVPRHSSKPMINLDERYHDYLTNPTKKFRIDGVGEKVTGYGYHCEDGDIAGHYVITENYKLFYNRNEQFVRMEALREAVIEA
jgi:hypothetical protein